MSHQVQVRAKAPQLADRRRGYRRWRWQVEEPPEVEAVQGEDGRWEWICSRCGPGRCEHVAFILAAEPVEFPDRGDEPD